MRKRIYYEKSCPNRTGRMMNCAGERYWRSVITAINEAALRQYMCDDLLIAMSFEVGQMRIFGASDNRQSSAD